MNKRFLRDLAQRYEALLLDNDGTCATTEELHARVGTDILREAGIEDMTYEERFSYTGFGEFGIWEHLDRQGRTPRISKEEFKQRQSERFRAAVAALRDPEKLRRKGIAELVDAFHRAGKPVWVVSNTDRDAVMAVQKAAGLDGKIDGYVTFDDIQEQNLHKKPAPDAYLLAMEKAGCTGKQCLAVEDSETGLRAALDAGCDTIHIFYNALNQAANPRATYAVPDHLDVRKAFNRSKEAIKEFIKAHRPGHSPKPG